MLISTIQAPAASHPFPHRYMLRGHVCKSKVTGAQWAILLCLSLLHLCLESQQCTATVEGILSPISSSVRLSPFGKREVAVVFHSDLWRTPNYILSRFSGLHLGYERQRQGWGRWFGSCSACCCAQEQEWGFWEPTWMQAAVQPAIGPALRRWIKCIQSKEAS